MQSQVYDSSSYIYGLVAIIIVVLIAIGVNCYLIYKSFIRKSSGCKCKSDAEKNIPIPEEVPSSFKKLDDSTKESYQKDEQSTSDISSRPHDVTQLTKTKTSKSTSKSIPIPQSRTKAEVTESNVDNLERLVRKMEIETLIEKMEQQQSSESQLTAHKKDNHKNSESAQISKPIEFKPIPTNVNKGSDIIPTIWKESELPMVYIKKTSKN